MSTAATTLRTSRAVAGRSLMLIPRVPSTFIPSLVMPVFLTIAIAGAFSGLVRLPGFPARQMLDWVVPFTCVQGAAFAGITTGMGVARDLESGFFDRFLLAPVPRAALLAGPLAASVARSFFAVALTLLVGIIGGVDFYGGFLGVAVLIVASMGVALIAGEWATALALKFKTMQVAPLMQTAVFLAFFLSTAQMPLHLLTGWLHTVARFNPFTNILELARQGFLGEVTWQNTWPGLVSLAGLIALLGVFAYRQIERVTP
jgi:ABC-2 type transport system permease protein